MSAILLVPSATPMTSIINRLQLLLKAARDMYKAITLFRGNKLQAINVNYRLFGLTLSHYF